MPTRTYECPKCEYINLELSVNEEDIKVCPDCGSEVKRIFKAISSIWNCPGAYGKGK